MAIIWDQKWLHAKFGVVSDGWSDEERARGARLCLLCVALPSIPRPSCYVVRDGERDGAQLTRPNFKPLGREMGARRVSKRTHPKGSLDPTRNGDAQVPFRDLKLGLFGTGATPKAVETLFGWRHGPFLGRVGKKLRT